MSEIQIVGPYFTNYSYARVNRGLANGLNKIQKDNKISLYCDPEKIDYLPTAEEVSHRNDLRGLVTFESGNPHVVIYNNFPKNLGVEHGFAEMPGNIKLMYIA